MKISLVVLIILLSSKLVSAQNKYEKSIIAFEQADVQNPVERTNLIVFTGSSAVARWNSLKQDFPDKNIINRGFGGSITTDLIEFEKRIIAIYQPKQVVIYIGDNDLSSAKKSVDQVFADMKTLFQMIRTDSKHTRITFLSIKPSPSRRNLLPQQLALNAKLTEFVKSQPNADFIDVFSPMVLQHNQMQAKYYVADSLHLTPSGYELWAKTISPYLK